MASENNTPQAQPHHPIRVGIIGMGGFAGWHHDVIRQLEAKGLCKLICTCDPDPGAFMDKMHDWEFTRRNVMVFDHYLDMLDTCAGDLDLVTIPTPVPLHAQMHRACVERGLAVYLEKPPTLNYAELDEMLAVETGAHTPTNVGFNYIVEKPRQALKKRILQNEFGRVKKVSFSGLWPRSHAYYQRANWAGRLMLDGKLVLDSCVGNAMAHYIHNVLFWAGLKEMFDWASVKQVRAELYRAHAIQGADTFFIVAQTDDEVALQLALTHACDGLQRHHERVECDDATITYITNTRYEIDHNDAVIESQAVPEATLRDNLEAHLAFMRGDGLPLPLTRLSDSRPFVHLNDLAYIASREVATIPARFCHTSQSVEEQGQLVAINDIDAIVERFFSTGQFPSDQHIPWAHTGGGATCDDLPGLFSVVQSMAEKREEETR